MILELKIQNFLSFKDEVIFSFEATADKTHEDYYVTEVTPGVRILKLAIVYGANASGKTNLIEAFAFIKHFIQTNRKSKNEGTEFIPFLLGETKNKIGKFELTFYVNKTKYLYNIELDSDKIILERLQYYPGTQPASIFIRTYDAQNDSSRLVFGPKIKIERAIKDELTAKLLKNISFFASHNQVNYTQPQLDEIFNWFSHQFLTPITPKHDLIGLFFLCHTLLQLKKYGK